jgi:hypothetical protein
VDRDSFHLVADELHLAGVHARPDIEAEVADGADRSMGTGDRARRAVERGEETVAGAPDLSAAVADELGADGGVMGLQQGARAAVTELGRRELDSTMSVKRTTHGRLDHRIPVLERR